MKLVKLLPIVINWFSYNKFCNMNFYKYKLFFLRKRALKMFKKEIRQDFYSSKRNLEKLYFYCNFFKINFMSYSNLKFLDSHLCFFINFDFLSLFCLHCGMRFGF